MHAHAIKTAPRCFFTDVDALVRQGLGWEDVCTKLKVWREADRNTVRAYVLRVGK